MKIWHQSMTELEEYPQYARALQAHAAKIFGGSVDVVLHGLSRGTYRGVPPGRSLYSPFAYHVLLRQVLDGVLRAEAEGFDAFVIGSYSEPFLAEARSAVDIPVVSVAESTLLTACSVATHSVLVTMSANVAYMIRRIVERHALTARVAAVRYLSPGLDEVQLATAVDRPEEFLRMFREAATQGIQSFADVVIPAEGIMNEILVAHDVSEVDGVSVMDANAVAWLSAEYMVKLFRSTGLHPGRNWSYSQLGEHFTEHLRSQLRS